MTVTMTKAAKVAGLMAGSYSEETRAEVVAIVGELVKDVDYWRGIYEVQCGISEELRATNEGWENTVYTLIQQNDELTKDWLRLKKRPPLIGKV